MDGGAPGSVDRPPASTGTQPSAYQKQNGDFRLVKATLIYYEAEFHKKYEPTKIEGAVVYWNVDEQRWTTFQVENFMEWRPIV